MDVLVELLFNAFVKYLKRDKEKDKIDKEYSETFKALYNLLGEDNRDLVYDFEHYSLLMGEKQT